eukprot:1155298-Amphidinium_carterae.1
MSCSRNLDKVTVEENLRGTMRLLSGQGASVARGSQSCGKRTAVSCSVTALGDHTEPKHTSVARPYYNDRAGGSLSFVSGA